MKMDEDLIEALRPFARMHREECDPDEIACIRGTGFDKTAISSEDFQKAFELLAKIPCPGCGGEPDAPEKYCFICEGKQSILRRERFK